MSDPNEHGSHHYSEDQSYENDALRLTEKHENHEAFHRDRERILEERFRLQIGQLKKQLVTERRFFEEVIQAISGCFWRNGDLRDDFGRDFEDNIEGVNKNFHRLLDDPDHAELSNRLEKLGEIVTSLTVKISQAKDKNRELEKSLMDVAQQARKDSASAVPKPAMMDVGVSNIESHLREDYGAGEGRDHFDELFLADDDKSLQQRHNQLNESGEVRRLADEREKRLSAFLQALVTQTKSDLMSDQPIGEGGLQNRLNTLVEAMKDFYDGDKPNSSPPPVPIDGEVLPEKPIRVSLDGQDFDNLTDFLSIFGQLPDLGEPFKNQRPGRGLNGKKAHQAVQLPGLMKGVDEVFKKAKKQTAAQTAASLAAEPVFEELLNLFVENAIAELMVDSSAERSGELETRLQAQLRGLLNFNRQFWFGCEKISEVYLAGLRAVALVASFLVELGLEVAQRLAEADAAHNPAIPKLKHLHEKVRQLFEDKHYKVFAKDPRLFLATEEERQAHFARLSSDFEDFVAAVQGEAESLGKEVRNKGH